MPKKNADRTSLLLKALANTQRLRVLRLLAGRELSVSQIHKALPDLAPSPLSQHLARLREAGLIHGRRESHTIWYALEPKQLRELITTLQGMCHATDTLPSRPMRRGKQRDH